MQQQTLKKQISFNGFGIHTAKFSEVTLSPLPENAGIVFRQMNQTAKYISANVQGDARGTQVVLPDGTTIMTVEHLVSAVVGLGLDNVLIEVDGPEVPIKDGSPKFFVELINSVGLKKQKSPRNYFKIPKKIVFNEADKTIIALPADSLKVHFLLDYPDNSIPTDVFSFELGKDDYTVELAGARTYGMTKEVEALWQDNKALGATLQNAILVSEKGYSTELRYPDELVRHKVVDFLGDIMALGSIPQGEFFVIRSGHAFNQKLVKKLLK